MLPNALGGYLKAMPSKRTLSPLEPVIDKIEATEALDAPAKAINVKFDEVMLGTRLKDAISGTQVGHALHPMLTDVVIGSFLSATALDLIGDGGDGTASERLIMLGIAAYPPTALTGTSDWVDGSFKNDSARRVGMVHAVANSTALALYGASLAARRRGSRRAGVALGLLGAGALGAAAYLGGHLTLVTGFGVDQTAFERTPDNWTEAADVATLEDGVPLRVVVGDTPVLVLREGQQTFAIHDRCSHRGCSLAAGRVEDGVVECPCHGSRFALADGALLKGPATQPQPNFEVRVRKGKVEIRKAP